MNDLTSPVSRRRTFAVISHPDAGKTTLTEKLLLMGGAIQLAGEVKAKKNLDEAIKSLNDQMASNKTGLGFSMDKSLQRPVVVVQNTATGEVVRKIPTEVVIRMAHSIDEMKGLLLNKSV